MKLTVRFAFFGTTIFLGLTLAYSYGQDSQSTLLASSSGSKSRDDSAELAAIRTQSQAFVAAFNEKNSKAIAALWAVNGEYVDETGRSFFGRDAIENGYAEFFKNSADLQLRVMIDSLRLLSNSTAIEDGRAYVDPLPAGAPGYSRYTAIHVKVDAKWLMASVRDTHVDTPSSYENIADLEFLIGTWKAEEHGNTIESVCRWVANKSFVERKYTIMHVDGSKISGVQLIGWNPVDEYVQSWSFSPDGGHAVGIWSLTENGWSAEMEGVTGNGYTTTSINTLRRLDENAYVWQSVQRNVNGEEMPDTEEVVLKRK